jgi:glycosyltransferase involved in cell wall biosynthesis
VSTITADRCRVALLVNFIPPYRVPLFQALRTLVGELRIFASAAVESNRTWPREWGDLPVVLQHSVALRKRWRRPDGFVESGDIHLPYDTLGQLRRFRPNVVVSGELGLRSWLAAIYKRRTPEVALLLWATVSERTERRRGLLRTRLRPRLLKQADAVLVNGASGARYITSLGVPATSVWSAPYTADASLFGTVPRCDSPRSAVRLLYVGQLTPRKGVTPFLRALAAWTANHPDVDVEFRIAGHGPERPALESIARPSNLTVEFLGDIAYHHLPRVYAESSILVLPTLEDEWAVVVNEALAAGLPVLGSRYSAAVEELVRDGENGWTFVPDDQQSVGAAMTASLTMPEAERERMRDSARARVAALTPGRVATDIAAAIDHVLWRRHGTGMAETSRG